MPGRKWSHGRDGFVGGRGCGRSTLWRPWTCWAPLWLSQSPGRESIRPTKSAKMIIQKIILLSNDPAFGRELWSRWLREETHVERLWVWIPAHNYGWYFFTLIWFFSLKKTKNKVPGLPNLKNKKLFKKRTSVPYFMTFCGVSTFTVWPDWAIDDDFLIKISYYISVLQHSDWTIGQQCLSMWHKYKHRLFVRKSQKWIRCWHDSNSNHRSSKHMRWPVNHQHGSIGQI